MASTHQHTGYCMSSFDSPIGYAKNPLLSTKSISHFPTITPNLGFPLQRLPFEIRCAISNHLSQYDCLNLLRTSKEIYSSTIDRLYQNIVVDANFKRFDNEHEYGWFKNSIACTYISSPYNLRRFLKVAPNQVIRYFECTSLPESLNIYDYGLHNDLLTFFGTCHHLILLIWCGVGFDMQYIQNLQNKNLLTKLILHTNDDMVDLELPLTHFELHPASLQQLKKLRITTNLEVLKLGIGRYEKSSMSVKCQDLIMVGVEHTVVSQLVDLINLIINLPIQNLNTLGLENVLVSPKDAPILISSIDISKLTTLILRSVSEYQIVPTRIANVRQYLEPSFLNLIAPNLKNLRSLILDYREAYKLSISDFLSELPGLESLDLTIRFNDTFSEGIVFYHDLGLSLSSLTNLRKLALESRREYFNFSNSTIDHLTSVPPNTQLYTHHLRKLKKLKTLRINPGSEHFEVAALVLELPDLSMLDIFGSRAGGSPNLGLGMVHPSVYDEWFKVQHVATQYVLANSGINYIRINRYVFEVVGDAVNPRSGLDRWFDNH